jgi:hypothetical protein
VVRRNDEQRKGARSRREINERDERKDIGGQEGTRSHKIQENQSSMRYTQLRKNFHQSRRHGSQLIMNW